MRKATNQSVQPAADGSIRIGGRLKKLCAYGKQALSLMLAFCIVLSLLPTLAFADSGANSHTVTLNGGSGGILKNGNTAVDGNSATITVAEGDKLPAEYTVSPNSDYAIQNFKVETGLEVVQVEAGGSHTALLASDGRVYTCGRNGNGQLGRSGDTTILAPITLPGNAKAKQVAAGEMHTLVLTEDGKVYSFGWNSQGQLGRDTGSYNYSATPGEMSLPTGEKAVQIASGLSHSLVLTENGKLLSCGHAGSGQLGRAISSDKPKDRLHEMELGNITNITQIAAGDSHTVVLAGGLVYGCGHNGFGQLGLERSRLLTTDVLIAMNMQGVTDVEQISAGNNYTIILADGKVYACGHNGNGQLGRDTGVDYYSDTFTAMSMPGIDMKAAYIAAGAWHTLVLTTDGDVLSCGDNDYDQLGRRDNVGGNGANYTLKKMTGLPSGIKPTQLAGGYEHSVILADGKAYACGSNYDGQLGTGGPNYDGSYNVREMKATVNFSAVKVDYVNTLADITVTDYTTITAQYKAQPSGGTAQSGDNSPQAGEISPQTGDDSSVLFWVTLMLISAAVVTIIATKKAKADR